MACTASSDCCAGLGCIVPSGSTSGTCQAASCPSAGQACTSGAGCCAGLSCEDGAGNTCGATGACTCIPQIG
jgi:hypothetical protein